MKTQYNFLAEWLKAHTKSERGAAMVEYALLLALIAVIAIGAITLLGQRVDGTFDSINSQLDDANPAAAGGGAAT